MPFQLPESENATGASVIVFRAFLSRSIRVNYSISFQIIDIDIRTDYYHSLNPTGLQLTYAIPP